MATTPSDMKTRFPEFSSYDDAFLQLHIDDAECDLDKSKFPECVQDRAVCFLAAHYAALAIRSSTGKGVGQAASQMTGKTVDKVSATYASVPMKGAGDVYWNSTIYGQQFSELVRRFCAGMVSLNGC